MNFTIPSTLPTLETVPSLLAALGIAVTILIAYFQRSKKSLSYQLTADRLVSVDGDEGYEQKVRVLYGDVEIRNLSRIEVRISNSGNRPILPDDFIEPMTITSENPAKILTVTLVDQRPKGIVSEESLKVSPDDCAVTVPALLLNPKDSFTVRSHITDLDYEPAVSGRIVGVKEITKNPSQSEVGAKILAYLAIIAAIAGGVWTVWNASVWGLGLTYAGLLLMVSAIVVRHRKNRNRGWNFDN